jgi:DHA1 family bicyclomycin/chloramphenicol resistance-like MFS transporter
MAEKDGKALALKEFVFIIALLMSLVALAIDAVLPAMPLMAKDLGVVVENKVQYIIGVLFAGFTIGQLFYGPFSDSYGRKTAVYVGMIIFFVGSLISLFATDFNMMLIGRLLQGIGASSCRITTLAMVRDLYSGRDMARVMSFVVCVFIFVPVVAPALGQGIMYLFNWRAIYAFFILMAIIGTTWMYIRLPETVNDKNKREFSLRTIWGGTCEVIKNKETFGYTICAGFIFGGLVGYLSSAQQIFLSYFKVGDLFPLYFAVSAISVGMASFVNGRIVKKYGMRLISLYALCGIMFAATIFLSIFFNSEHVPIWAFLTFAPLNFFCLGLLFGNLNALAMEPMGHIAGLASSIIGSLSSAISVAVGTFIGQSYNGTLNPLIFGFLITAVLTFLTMIYIDKKFSKLASIDDLSI